MLTQMTLLEDGPHLDEIVGPIHSRHEVAAEQHGCAHGNGCKDNHTQANPCRHLPASCHILITHTFLQGQ